MNTEDLVALEEQVDQIRRIKTDRIIINRQELINIIEQYIAMAVYIDTIKGELGL